MDQRLEGHWPESMSNGVKLAEVTDFQQPAMIKR